MQDDTVILNAVENVTLIDTKRNEDVTGNLKIESVKSLVKQ